MHELDCPSCNASANYDQNDYIHMCPVCSSSFVVDYEHGRKELYGDHFIVPNQSESARVRESVLEWLRRLHHKPGQTEKEFIVSDIRGFSLPFWVVSVEVHTSWKGFVERQNRSFMDPSQAGRYLSEQGGFTRSYRWCVSARDNLFEQWGVKNLHVPNEAVTVSWDGFPLDSTFTRGILEPDALIKKVAGETIRAHVYDEKESFDFKFANGVNILGIQVPETEAIRRAQWHIEQYHNAICKLNVDTLVDIKIEFDYAGVQLIHLPFWFGKYVYQPSSALAYFQPPKERNIIVEGFTNGILNGEFVMTQGDKLLINSYVSAAATLIFLIMGFIWHPAFILVAVFSLVVGLASARLSENRKKAQSIKNLQSPEAVAVGLSDEKVS